MSSKRYPEEFKVEAVKQVVNRGHSVADVASRLGMTTTHCGENRVYRLMRLAGLRAQVGYRANSRSPGKTRRKSLTPL